MSNNNEDKVLSDTHQEKEKPNLKKKNPEVFTEHLSFYHQKSLFANYETIQSKIREESSEQAPQNVNFNFPFLTTQEFAFSTLTPIENDKYLNTSLSITSSKNEIISIILSRIKSFSLPTSTSDYKKAFVSNAAFYMEIIGLENTSNYLIPCLSKIIDEPHELQLTFLKVCKEIIGQLYLFGEEGYQIIINNILTLINEIYKHSDKDILKEVYDNYITIARYLKKDDLAKILLTKIISLSLESNANNDTNSLIQIVKMIGVLADKFEDGFNEQFIIPQLLMISQNESDLVRVELCSIIPKIAKYVSFECLDKKLNPLVEKLLEGDEESGSTKVKENIIEILCELMKIYHEKSLYDTKIKNDFYINIYKKMIFDKNKKVRLAAFEIIGEFLSLLNIEEVDQSYLTYFISVIDQYYFNIKDFKIDIDDSLLYPAAYNFPAVLFRYGASAWPSLKKCYLNLCTSNSEKVVLSLMSSFDEVSKILGIEITENELLKIYDVFMDSFVTIISDKSSEYFIKTLKRVNPALKTKYYCYYMDYFGGNALENPMDINTKFEYSIWRNKINHAETIECFYNSFALEVIYIKFVPVLITFCIDDFYKVRKKCSRVLSELLIYLKENSEEKYIESIVKILHAFAYSVCFHMRSEFCKICEFLLIDKDLYTKYLKDMLKIVLHDKIFNVRMSLAKMCYNIIIKKKHFNKNYLLYDKDFLTLCAEMVDDKSKSIREKFDEKAKEKIFERIKSDNIEIEKSEHNFYYSFHNNMNFLVDEFNIDLPTVVTNYTERNSVEGEEEYTKKFY